MKQQRQNTQIHFETGRGFPFLLIRTMENKRARLNTGANNQPPSNPIGPCCS